MKTEGDIFIESYRELQKKYRNCHPQELTESVVNFIKFGISYLNTVTKIELISKVPDKAYFAFLRNPEDTKTRSRAINSGLFNLDILTEEHLLNVFSRSTDFSSENVTQTVYSSTILVCAANDLLKRNDQKSPGTMFEIFITCILKNFFKIEPKHSLEVLNLDMATKLPTDLIFDLGSNNPKFHIPIKTSTRERMIQLYAHQRVLDGVYGVGRFAGLPMILAETKTDSRKLEVVEICLPDQWVLYQMYISQLWGVCYLDMPIQYSKLAVSFPKIQVCTLGDYLGKGGRLSVFLNGI